MNLFWTNFWSNFFANLAVVVVLTALGYVAKNKIIKDLKKFIDEEVVHSLSVTEQVKKHSNNNETDKSPKAN